MSGRKFSESYSLGVGISEDAAGEAKEEDESRVRGLDSVFGVIGKWKRDRGLTHEELLSQPLALMLLEDLDQPYVDIGSKEKRKAPVIEGAGGLRSLLGIHEEE